MEFDQDVCTFKKFVDADGKPARHCRVYHDDHDFKINPQLLKELNLAECLETEPEARAVWTYLRLCETLKFDEGYLYHHQRSHPNDAAASSFNVIENVTAATPVTCYNFSRLAVNLFNQIDGVNAVLIGVGNYFGHFKFGFYTKRMSVEAEAVSPINGFNDMTRVKLGIQPAGLRVLRGQNFMDELMQSTVRPMLWRNKKDLRRYLFELKKLPPTGQMQPINLDVLVGELKANGVDGSSLVQLLLSMNRNFTQAPYKIMRAGLKTEHAIQPQLIVRQADQYAQIDLNALSVQATTPRELGDAIDYGAMIYPDGGHTLEDLER